MNSNTDELTKDPKNDASQGPGDPDKGFELDKLKIPKGPEAPQQTGVSENEPRAVSEPEPPAAPDPEHAAEPESKPLAKPINKKVLIAIAGLVVILILGATSFLLVNMMRSSPSEIEADSTESTTYQEIEPIVTNLGQDNYINIGVAIRFNPNKQPEFLIFQSKVKDTILSFLVSPELRKRIVARGSQKNEVYIHNELTKRLQQEYGSTVIIKELRIF